MKDDIITSDEELIQMVKDGLFFNFCIAHALNLGYRDAIKSKEKVKFSVGEYDVEFNGDDMCFTFTHQRYIARIIMAYYQVVNFIGTDEDEVISELLAEVEKELMA